MVSSPGNSATVPSMGNRQPHEQDKFHLTTAPSTSHGQKSVDNDHTNQYSQSLSLPSIGTSNTISLGSSNGIEIQFDCPKNQLENIKSQFKNLPVAYTIHGQKSVYNDQNNQYSQSLSLSSITTSNSTSLGSSKSIEIQYESPKSPPENLKSQYKNFPVASTSHGQKSVYNDRNNQYSQSLSLSSITASNSTSLGSSNSVEIQCESPENQPENNKSQYRNLPVTGK